ncbi:MAG TPA: hypothetical protein VFI18_13095 [Gaiellales bacterium]|nr:hypothetical protein [Gaiellales bacterium]
MNRRTPVRTAVVAGAAFIGLALPATAQAAKNWAVVQGNGTLVRGNGVTTVTHPNTGVYIVTFTADVHGCAYVGNPGDPSTGAVSTASTVSVARRAGSRHALYIQVWNQQTGAPADFPFHLVAYCGATSKFAVVGKGGVIARGKHALSARRITKGEYSVHFDSNVSNCVFLATVGATKATPVVDPGTISVARGKKPHNVFVTTIGRSGSVASSPFHLALNCGTTPFRAVVKANGTIARGRGTDSSTHLGVAGEYQVAFTQNVTGCAFVATVGAAGSGISTLPLTITTATRMGNPNAAFIWIKKTDGTNVDHAFHLVARC